MNAIVPITVHADDLEVIQRTAKLLAVSGYFDAKGESIVAIAQLATKILAGRELGFGPFAAARGIYIIKGNPSISANLMASAVKGSGRYDYRVKELTDANCAVEFFELSSGKRESLGVSSFSAVDAKKAGTQNMDRFPRNMLFARAMSNGVRFYTPDVFSGNAVYLPEELGANVDGEGNVIEGTVRAVDASTGEILQGATDAPGKDRSGYRLAAQKAERIAQEVRSATQGSSTQPRAAAPRVAPLGPAIVDGDELFGKDAPWYVAARDNLQNGVRKFADAALNDHRNGGPAEPKLYGWLAGLLDSVIEQATGAEDGHKRVLAVLCQGDIGRDNRPSAMLTSKLLGKLATTIGDNKVANPNYDQRIVDACVAVYRAAEAIATPTLFDAKQPAANGAAA